ncbi:hypothetical protein AB0B25_32100, partial [Nocardia sp. NPDC049190]|uniref:hypothetical protein n=1 Tax=Nocardia sp. NPDC049190 TaxID=3155650 RepID=UPI0033EC7A90
TTLTGMLWLAAQPSSQTAVANTGSRPLRAITPPGISILCAITFAVGGILGAKDCIASRLADVALEESVDHNEKRRIFPGLSPDSSK